MTYQCVWVCLSQNYIQAMVVITIIKIRTHYISFCVYFHKDLFSSKGKHVIEYVTNKTELEHVL